MKPVSISAQLLEASKIEQKRSVWLTIFLKKSYSFTLLNKIGLRKPFFKNRLFEALLEHCPACHLLKIRLLRLMQHHQSSIRKCINTI